MEQRPMLRVNDGSDRPPRLEIHQSWWAMIGLPSGEKPWTVEQKFERIARAGFTGILESLPPPEEEHRWRALLDQYGFRFGAFAFPAKALDLVPVLERAIAFGASYVNAQVMDSFVIDEAAIDLLSGLITEAARAGIPLFVETHRGRVTQDLIRTVGYVKAIPDLRLTIDFSHYVVAGEMGGPDAKAQPYFETLLERTSAIHARVSNGQQVQIDIGPNGEHPQVEMFLAFWETGMRRWLATAKPGDILPFIPELGPPTYAITRRISEGTDQEISDRFTQALVLKRLGEVAWERAQR